MNEIYYDNLTDSYLSVIIEIIQEYVYMISGLRGVIHDGNLTKKSLHYSHQYHAPFSFILMQELGEKS